jgi:hypothetical protein
LALKAKASPSDFPILSSGPLVKPKLELKTPISVRTSQKLLLKYLAEISDPGFCEDPPGSLYRIYLNQNEGGANI